MNITKFKEIPEYPNYLISPQGEVYSLISNRLLSISTNTTGYKYFRVENGTKNLLLSRVLARVYKDLPSLDSKLEVDHDDRDKNNNDLDNLIVRTKEEHIAKTVLERGFIIQTESFCSSCGVKITKGAQYCREHYKTVKSDITVEQIEYWVKNYSWVRASKELGLSDNGLRKRYKALTGKDPKNIKKPS